MSSFALISFLLVYPSISRILLHRIAVRGTLITTRRPNYGAGALRDREAGQQSQYLRTPNEQRLFAPLQNLTFQGLTSANAGEEKERQASLFYRQLGEDCARNRVSLDVVVTSSSLTAQPPPSSSVGATAMRPNVREFLDVATLSELCRVSCGKFKWLRVGNECGITVDESNDGCSFTGEQLREELK